MPHKEMQNLTIEDKPYSRHWANIRTKATIPQDGKCYPSIFLSQISPISYACKSWWINSLLEEGITLVKYEKWSVVPVQKPADYKLTVMQIPPKPRVDELFAALVGGKQFPKYGHESCIPTNTHGWWLYDITFRCGSSCSHLLTD